MPLEIERKFLVDPQWRPSEAGTVYVQGYIGTSAPGRTVRVRIQGDEARLTIKGPTTGLSRAEFEYPIPVEDARQMLATLCDPPFVEKVRHHVSHAGHLWEVDVFGGANEGLVVAEIELDSEDEVFERPAWLGAEVSLDPRYANSRLAKSPWTTWGAKR